MLGALVELGGSVGNGHRSAAGSRTRDGRPAPPSGRTLAWSAAKRSQTTTRQVTPPGCVARRCGSQRGEPKEGRQVAAPPCGVNRSEPPRPPQINLTERLFVVSVSVAEVNWTVIGGLQLGEKVAVTEIV